MRVLQFGFDGSPANPHLPHNYDPRTTAYTGTHDSAITLEWYESLDAGTRTLVGSYLPRQSRDMPWPMIEEVFASVARLAIIPMQDLLGLGASSRMNTPGTVGDNWNWRFDWNQLPAGLSAEVSELLHRYGRR